MRRRHYEVLKMGKTNGHATLGGLIWLGESTQESRRRRLITTLIGLGLLLVGGIVAWLIINRPPPYIVIDKSRYSLDIVDLTLNASVHYHNKMEMDDFTQYHAIDGGMPADLSEFPRIKGLVSLRLVFDAAQISRVMDFSPLGKNAVLRSLAVENYSLPLTSLARLTNLESLTLVNCDAMTDLAPLASLTSLTVLTLGGCDNIVDFSMLRSLPQLKKLTITDCSGLVSLDDLANLASLETLEISDCANLRDIDALSALSGLRRLSLIGTPAAADAAGQLENLRELDLSRSSIENLDALAGLANLQSLYLSESAISDIIALPSLKSLELLDITRADYLLDLDPLASCDTITTVYATCYHVQQTRAGERYLPSVLADMSGLTRLRLDFLPGGWHDASYLPELTALTHLECIGAHKGDIDGIPFLENLVELKMTDSPDLISDYRNISNLTKLQKLDLSNNGLKDVQCLANLTQLTELNLRGNRQLADVSALAELTQLEELTLIECDTLSNLNGVNGLTRLTTLRLTDCDSLTSFAELGGLMSLRTLVAYDCDQLVDIGGIAGLPSLETLVLQNCRKLADIAPIATLPSLAKLDLNECELLTSIQPLASVQTLVSLDLAWTDNVNDLSPLKDLVNLARVDLCGYDTHGMPVDYKPVSHVYTMAWHDWRP